MSSGSPTASTSSVVSRSKLVVRRLPPTLPEELFWKSVSTWVTDETCSWKRYVKGKDGNGQDGHLIHSRAYCLMSSPEALVNFHRGFDGHVFRSKTGGEHQAVVEYSPLQKTPYKAKVKVDARQGTIDDDPDYLSFLESLNAAPTKPVIEVSVPAPQPLITPLIEHLRAAKTSKSQAKSASKLAQSSSAEDARRSAALAAVNKAAARRGPPAQGGPTMVAGKGREVMITPTSSTDMAGNAGGEGKKKKGKRERGGSPARGVSPVRGSQASVGPHGSSTLAPAASIASNGMRAPSPALVGGESRGGGRGRGGRGGRGRGIGDGGGGGGGRGRGRGGPERTAHEAVLQILTTNSYAERGRGRGGGRGGGSGGRGGAVSDAGTSEARIDM